MTARGKHSADGVKRELYAFSVLTSLIILTASRVRPSFLEHMASLLFMYTNTFVSLPVRNTRQRLLRASNLRDTPDAKVLHYIKCARARPLPFTLMWPCRCVRCVPGTVLTVLGFVLCAVMLQLLAAAVATFSGLQRLFKQTLRFHDGRGFFLRQQDVRRGTATGEEESLSPTYPPIVSGG